MFDFSILDYDTAPWERIESCTDHLVFKSRPWLDFLRETQRVEPLLIAVGSGGRDLGYFVGAALRRGVRIIASPFEGWTTEFQGLSTLQPVPPQERLEIYRELIRFCYRVPGCSFFQATDWSLRPEDMDGSALGYRAVEGYRLDLGAAEDAIFSGFHSATRRAIRKAQKGGVTVGEPRDLERFVADYYDQLRDVFHKQGLAPTYPRTRVQALVKHLHPTGNLLLLESRDPDGRCIATGIFPGGGRLAQFWGGASYRAQQILRPNEILFWEALRYWKRRGMAEFEFGGRGAYKAKFGPEPYARVQIIAPRWKVLATLKTAARAVYCGLRSRRLSSEHGEEDVLEVRP